MYFAGELTKPIKTTPVKNIFIFAVILCSVSLSAQSWYNPGGNQGQHITSIGFETYSQGYAATMDYQGNILHTADSARNWYSQQTGGSIFYTMCVSPYGIYAGDNNGNIYQNIAGWYKINGV